MNTVNNKRRQNTKEKIEKAFIDFLQDKEISQITVSDICKETGFNRSTFYANYNDIYDLADKLRDRLELSVNELYDNDMANNVGLDYLKLFNHIKENQRFYNTYFKLGYDNEHSPYIGPVNNNIFPDKCIDYHIEFHKAGLNAIIKKWLKGGCKEPAEEIARILKDEYKGRI